MRWQVLPHHGVAVLLGSLVVGSGFLRYCWIWRKIQGFELAARPIITASQLVLANHADRVLGGDDVAVADDWDLTAALTSAMRVQSALPA